MSIMADPNSGRGAAPVRISSRAGVIDLDPSGAAYLSETRTLLVADLHLEKGTSWGRRGIFLPPYDTAVTLQMLAGVVNKYCPEVLIFLGDSFHDTGGPARLQVGDRQVLEEVIQRQETFWIAGNHDPELADCLPGRSCQELAEGNAVFRHIPSADRKDLFEFSGHLHPVASISGRGRSVRRRCFALDAGRMILPAFGAYTGGLNIRDDAFKGLFDQKSFVAHIIGDKQIYSFPGLPVSR